MSGLLAVNVGEAPYSLLVDAFVTSFFFTCSLVKLLSKAELTIGLHSSVSNHLSKSLRYVLLLTNGQCASSSVTFD